MKNDVASPGQYLSAGARFATYLGSINASSEAVDSFIKNGDHLFYEAIRYHFGPKIETAPQLSDEILKQIGSWGIFYKKIFGMDMDFSGVKIPEKFPGFDRLIIISKGLRLNRVWNIHQGLGIQTWKWRSGGSLEAAMRESERGLVKETYAFWVRDIQEADDESEDELRNLSAERIEEQKIDTECLLERLVHGIKYHDETKEYLDVKSVTLCAASRYADSRVPGVYCGGDCSVRISWIGVKAAYPLHIRARRTIR
jgi:hypothetical protein